MHLRKLLQNLGLISAANLLPETSSANNFPPLKKPILRIAHITDVHIQGMIGAVNGFEKCLHHIQSLSIKPDFIINSGKYLK